MSGRAAEFEHGHKEHPWRTVLESVRVQVAEEVWVHGGAGAPGGLKQPRIDLAWGRIGPSWIVVVQDELQAFASVGNVGWWLMEKFTTEMALDR